MMVGKDRVFGQMRNGGTVVVNVLSKGGFKKLHIRGSGNLPLTEDSAAFSKEVEGRFRKDKLFIVHGDHFGLRDGFYEAKALKVSGLKALNCSGGLREWHRSGLAADGTDAGPEPAVRS
jgi:rhodanese-related sulfurtransferase